MVRGAIAFVAASLLAACGPKSEDVPLVRSDHCPVGGCSDAGADTDAGPLVIPPEPLEPWDTAGSGPLTGIFAVETRISARVVIPVETRQIFRLRIVQDGKHIRQKTTLCAFKLPIVPDTAALKIPPELQALMQTKTIENEGDYLANAGAIGGAYAPPLSQILVGANLQNPDSDPLPELDDPKTPENEAETAIDEDKDGNPGVSLLASIVTCGSVGEVYKKLFVALRTKVELTGNVLTADEIQGKADVDLDQSVVGYDDECLATAAQINILIEPGSPFTAKRVGSAEDIDKNENVSCPELAAEAVQLFGDYWAD
jgi:hypothetical protein